MRTYVSPRAELILFQDDIVLSQTSGTCRCYVDYGVKNDYNAFGTPCWTDSEDASELYFLEGGPST